MRLEESSSGAVLHVPMGTGLRVLALLLLGVGGLSIASSLVMLLGGPRDIRFSCDRDNQACVLDNGSTKRTFVLADVRSFESKRLSGGESQMASIALHVVTHGGRDVTFCDMPADASLSSTYAADAMRVNGFLASPAKTSVEVTCREGGTSRGDAVLYLVMALALTGAGVFLGRVAESKRVELRTEGGVLRVIRTKLLGGAPREEHPLASIKAVELTSTTLRCLLADESYVVLSGTGATESERRCVESFRARLEAARASAYRSPLPRP
jgi:hypothetical protein